MLTLFWKKFHAQIACNVSEFELYPKSLFSLAKHQGSFSSIIKMLTGFIYRERNFQKFLILKFLFIWIWSYANLKLLMVTISLTHFNLLSFLYFFPFKGYSWYINDSNGWWVLLCFKFYEGERQFYSLQLSCYQLLL